MEQRRWPRLGSTLSSGNSWKRSSRANVTVVHPSSVWSPLLIPSRSPPNASVGPCKEGTLNSFFATLSWWGACEMQKLGMCFLPGANGELKPEVAVAVMS